MASPLICVRVAGRWPRREAGAAVACAGGHAFMRELLPAGSGVTRKRRSGPGWLRSSGKAASLSVWLLGLMRYQLRTKCSSGLLEKLQVKCGVRPRARFSRAGEKVRALQGLLEASWGERREVGRDSPRPRPPSPPSAPPTRRLLHVLLPPCPARPRGQGAHPGTGRRPGTRRRPGVGGRPGDRAVAPWDSARAPRDRALAPGTACFPTGQRASPQGQDTHPWGQDAPRDRTPPLGDRTSVWDRTPPSHQQLHGGTLSSDCTDLGPLTSRPSFLPPPKVVRASTLSPLLNPSCRSLQV